MGHGPCKKLTINSPPLCNKKVNYGVHNSEPRHLILYQLNPVRSLSFFNTNFVITFYHLRHSCRRFFLWSLPTKILYILLIDTMHATCSAHNLLLRNFIVLIISAKEFKLWSSSIFSFSLYFDFQCTRSKRSARHFAPLHLHALHVLV
jgi:hypothetical protein